MLTIAEVQHYIEECQEVSYSWFAGVLATALAPKVVDYWPDDLTCVAPGSIVVFPDELWISVNNLSDEEVKALQSTIVITSSKARYQYLLEKNIRAIFFPFIHWHFHLIPMRKLGLKPHNVPGEHAFNFLNSRWNPGRLHVIEHLFKFYPNLLDTGYVTANTFSYYKDHPRIQVDHEYRNSYAPLLRGAPVENNNHFVQGVPVSSNVINFIHVAKNIPGKISIQVETWEPNETAYPFITEKSLIGIVTQQIPIVIGYAPGMVDSYLRAQGFDVFDDLIDHSYDFEPDYFRRCELAIDLNKDWLSGCKKFPNIQSRLERNQDFLLGEWLDDSLLKLVHDVERAINE